MNEKTIILFTQSNEQIEKLHKELFTILSKDEYKTIPTLMFLGMLDILRDEIKENV